MTRDGALPVLTLRRLNRATLARQLLLRRARLDVVDAIERLAALQAQWAPSPYVALWSRLAGFAREQLWSAIERHAVIRARLMRGTLHLVSARDFYAYAVATQDTQRAAWNRIQVARGVAPERVATLAVAFARRHLQVRRAGARAHPTGAGQARPGPAAVRRRAGPHVVRSPARASPEGRGGRAAALPAAIRRGAHRLPAPRSRDRATAPAGDL